ncbi:ABC transporter ATP-binding protein [Thioclava sp. GXIMD2076]|uniref:metal ABC transporter ATP-binding protein n=1 Tax=Thioclava sp. GXIMD2076 TaxID=3131931 RepID=UPI0030CC6C76
MTTPITFDNVTLSYDRRPAVHHLSGCFAHGSKTAIVGPNGAGKSTLMKALMRQRLGVEGRIDFGGLRPNDFGYLPQLAEIERGFPMTVSDVVVMGAWRRIGAFRSIGKGFAQKVAAALEAVGMSGFESRMISSLSGGQMQRTLFARLIVQDAQVILLDEPFTAIDEATTRDLLDIIARWHGEGRTVIAVLHDIQQVRAAFPETLLIARRMIGWGSTPQVLTEDNLRIARNTTTAWMPDAGPCEPKDATR